MTEETKAWGLYSGLSVLHWRTISETDPMKDRGFFGTLLEENPGPAVELGCGAGRLLLSLMEDGFDVSGRLRTTAAKNYNRGKVSPS